MRWEASLEARTPEFISRAPIGHARGVVRSDTVEVWAIRVPDDPVARRRPGGRCSADEVLRAGRIRVDSVRDEFLAVRGVVRDILSRYLDTAPEALIFEYGPHGKPRLPRSPLAFSVSHSGNLALCGVSGRELGVDIERIRPMPECVEIARRFFGSRDCRTVASQPDGLRLAAFFRCWTRKEACAKASGLGLSLPFSTFDVGIDDRDPSSESTEVGADRWAVRNLSADPEWAAAVATSPDVECRVCQWTAI